MRSWHVKPATLVAMALIAVLLFGAATIAHPHNHASGSVCQICHAGHLFTLDVHPPCLGDPLHVVALQRPIYRCVPDLDGVAFDHASRAPPA
ncbi:MAG TPA: hypothetical protein VE994_17260 [Terriglobales bacterium]|nr:hypothetical protein [Terriglobales bacterium]